jgi:hypothetical protein
MSRAPDTMAITTGCIPDAHIKASSTSAIGPESGEPMAADSWLPVHLARLDGDPIEHNALLTHLSVRSRLLTLIDAAARAA